MKFTATATAALFLGLASSKITCSYDDEPKGIKGTFMQESGAKCGAIFRHKFQRGKDKELCNDIMSTEKYWGNLHQANPGFNDQATSYTVGSDAALVVYQHSAHDPNGWRHIYLGSEATSGELDVNE
jgi:hypothetical protein